MKTPIFLLVGLCCFFLASCNETKVIDEDQDPGDQTLGASVQAILEEEHIEEAIWNPENIEAPDVPAIHVNNEEELRALIKSLQLNAQKMKRTFEQINQVNHTRYEAYSQQMADCQNRKDSLQVAMKYPDIVHLRDTTELLVFGLVSQK